MQDKQMVERQAERAGLKVTASYSGMGTPTAIADALDHLLVLHHVELQVAEPELAREAHLIGLGEGVARGQDRYSNSSDAQHISHRGLTLLSPRRNLARAMFAGKA